MAPTVRRRTRKFEPETGTTIELDTKPVKVTERQSWRIHHDCEDVIGDKGGNHPFHMERTEQTIQYMYGLRPARPRTEYINVADETALTIPGHHELNMKMPTGTSLASRMSPNKPFVDLPVFLFEFKDLPDVFKKLEGLGTFVSEAPRLIKIAGESILRMSSGSKKYTKGLATGLADQNLLYQFGWGPLLSDFTKLLGVADAIERRQKQLNNLHSVTGLRRRVNVDKATVITTSSGVIVNSRGYLMKADTTTTTVGRRWAVSRWVTPPGVGRLKPPTELDAIRTLLGLNLDFATLWSILPWSWMVDWFGEAGNYLDAHRNTVPCRLERMALMTHTITTRQRTWVDKPDWLTGGLGRQIRETKNRVPMHLSLFQSSFQGLDARQVGILASLSVVRPSAWRMT